MEGVAVGAGVSVAAGVLSTGLGCVGEGSGVTSNGVAFGRRADGGMVATAGSLQAVNAITNTNRLTNRNER